jgi:hypothetical protein
MWNGLYQAATGTTLSSGLDRMTRTQSSALSWMQKTYLTPLTCIYTEKYQPLSLSGTIQFYKNRLVAAAPEVRRLDAAAAL